MNQGPQGDRSISTFGKVALLMATALALLATPMVSPAMRDISIAFANQIDTDPVAIALRFMMQPITDDVGIRFLVKFILLSVPALLIVLFSPIAGWLSDLIGRRRLLAGSLLLFGFSGVSGYFADTLTQLFLGRVLLGISVAGIKTLTVAMVGDYFTGKERNRFIGWQGSAMKVGGVVFLLFGGAMADIHWRAPFWGYALAFVALPGVLAALYDVRRPTLSAAQRLAVAPVPTAKVAMVMFSAFTASVLFFMTLVQMPFFAPERFGSSPGDVGIATALANLAGAVSAVYFHRLNSRLNYVGIFAVVFLMIGIGYAVVVLAPSFPIMLTGMLLAGLGFGLIVPAQSAWMLATVAPERRGFGIGLVTTAMFLGQAAAPVLIEPFIDPANPGRVFSLACFALFTLAAAYASIGWFRRNAA